MTPDEIESAVAAGMPQAVREDLKRLAAIPSVAFPGHPEEPVHAAAAMTEELLRCAGLPHVRRIPVEGSFPRCTPRRRAGRRADGAALRALRRAARPATRRCGAPRPSSRPRSTARIYGRGAADDKSGLIIARRRAARVPGPSPWASRSSSRARRSTRASAWRPSSSATPSCPRRRDRGRRHRQPAPWATRRSPPRCAAWSPSPSGCAPSKEPVHSGSFGGAAPDALAALIRDAGHAARRPRRHPRCPACPRQLPRHRPLGGGVPRHRGRARRRVAGRLRFAGRPACGPRTRSRSPAWTCRRCRRHQRGPGRRPRPGDRARSPGGRPEDDRDAVVDFLRRSRPGAPRSRVSDYTMGTGYLADTGGAARTALNRAMERAYGRPPRDVGARRLDPAGLHVRQAVPRRRDPAVRRGGRRRGDPRAQRAGEPRGAPPHGHRRGALPARSTAPAI